MGGEFGTVPAEPIILQKPEPKPTKPSAPDSTAVELAPLPDEIDVGDVFRDVTKEVDVSVLLRRSNGAMVTTLSATSANSSKPSVFRDQLGLDPEPTYAAQGARSFELQSTLADWCVAEIKTNDKDGRKAVGE